MKYDSYHTTLNPSLKFEFYSDGPAGKIKKQIAFIPFKNNPNVFNLGFGDVGIDDEVNDAVASGNKDGEKILATAALSILKFYEINPNSWVYAVGINKVRTRLYRKGISNNLDEILRNFHLFGFTNNAWEPFEVGKDYDAFLIKRKDNNLYNI